MLRNKGNVAAEKSLAVIPFESVGGDTANAYLAEGIADELTIALARLPSCVSLAEARWRSSRERERAPRRSARP